MVFLVLVFVFTLSLTVEASGKKGMCTDVRDPLVDKARSLGLIWGIPVSVPKKSPVKLQI